jgi:two-component system chemotaxis response regulator CheB
MNIQVLVVDDSALVRKVLTEIFERTPDITLADTAMDPIFAIEKIKKQEIDVIILDVEMPRMDGLTFLGKLMRAKPTPVIMLSSLTTKNAQISLQAMELGAFEVLAKPDDILDLPNLEQQIIEAVRHAANPKVKEKLINKFESGLNDQKFDSAEPLTFSGSRKTTDKLIAIGSSTGGTSAVSEILSKLPVDLPGIVVVQHMPPRFPAAFAERLNQSLPFQVQIAKPGDQIKPGFVYIAPGDRHVIVKVSGAKYYLEILDTERVNYHRPSVEVLFNSIAEGVGKNAIGIMLTGMGDDGSMAMKKMKDAGSYNIVQDEASSVVWGMPGKAVEYGGASKIVALSDIASEICQFLEASS